MRGGPAVRRAIVMMVLGFLAVAEPNVATIAVGIFVGWLFFIGGIFRALSVWQSRGMPGFAWSLLTALLAIVIDRLECFQAGPFPCTANTEAVLCIRTALEWLNDRTLDRIARGVEGRTKP